MDNNLFEKEKKWLLDEKYDSIESDQYTADVLLLQDGHPLDYLIGNREFLGCHIDLSNRPLIPRNETEYWVKDVIDTYRGPTPAILDIFSGSGCIGIACLKHLQNAHVDFAEKNPGFIKQIQNNLEINDIPNDKYTVYQSGIFSALPNGAQYDLVLANPPYIAHDRRKTVQDSVHEHEDYDSLYTDDDGLYFVKILVDSVSKFLKPGGSMYIEYDPWQKDAIVEYIQTNHPDLSHEIIKDQFDKNRVVRISPKAN